ncbi:MAG: hypothetical protein ACLPVY_06705 [Acidimicrobiia bacterium]
MTNLVAERTTNAEVVHETRTSLSDYTQKDIGRDRSTGGRRAVVGADVNAAMVGLRRAGYGLLLLAILLDGVADPFARLRGYATRLSDRVLDGELGPSTFSLVDIATAVLDATSPTSAKR